jgi:phosphoribosyl 1,2-cyclic phosphodiesterase
VSARYIKDCLKKFDIDIHDIDAVFITHEHSDHICGIEVLSRNYEIEVYSKYPTIKSILESGRIKRKDLFNSFEEELNIKDLNIRAFALNHDAVCPVGYCIDDGENKFSVITDTGCFTDDIYRAVKGSRGVLLESNHDIEMLQNGPYHNLLKKRIRSDIGHLSNDDAGRTAVKLAGEGTAEIILGHISSVNNNYDKVYESISYYLSVNGIKINEDVLIDIAKKNEASGVHIL